MQKTIKKHKTRRAALQAAWRHAEKHGMERVASDKFVSSDGSKIIEIHTDKDTGETTMTLSGFGARFAGRPPKRACALAEAIEAGLAARGIRPKEVRGIGKMGLPALLSQLRRTLSPALEASGVEIEIKINPKEKDNNNDNNRI